MGELLNGVGIRGFRSFHGELQLVSPLRKLNLIAGQNNSGKSNVLRVVRHMHDFLGSPPRGLDIPTSATEGTFEMAITLNKRRDELVDQLVEFGGGPNAEVARMLDHVLRADSLCLTGGDLVWLRFGQDRHGLSPRSQAKSLLGDGVNGNWLSAICSYMGLPNGEPLECASRILEHLTSFHVTWPDVRVIDASRRITVGDNGQDVAASINGAGLVKRLLALQSPSLEYDDDRDRFELINRFLRYVLGEEDARLEIPHDAAQINVRRNRVLLPLDNLGTGVSQVVILAAAATLERGKLLCMEEPEVHLHPVLQRKLLQYLHDETDNQYLIATHSAHMLDSNFAEVFHATYTYENGTEIVNAGNPHQLAAICHDLGYRPSDLLQANVTIWVEGPSDRIYLRHWISLVDDRLTEGIHYTIMFYGGRLLSHLTADDPDVREFISLRRLNRHLVVMIDSDKETARGKINDTKSRVVEELSKDGQPGCAWVTSGRNVENYVPPRLMDEVLAQEYPRMKLHENKDRWSDVLKPVESKKSGPDKVRVARVVVKRWKRGLEFLDLRKKVHSIVALIQEANGIQPINLRDIPKDEPTWDS